MNGQLWGDSNIILPPMGMDEMVVVGDKGRKPGGKEEVRAITQQDRVVAWSRVVGWWGSKVIT